MIKRSRLYTFLFCLIAALAELLDNAVDEVLTHQLSVALQRILGFRIAYLTETNILIGDTDKNWCY